MKRNIIITILSISTLAAAIAASCTKADPVTPSPTSKDKSFMDTNIYGYYSGTDKTPVTVVLAYDENTQQTNALTTGFEDSPHIFSIMDVENGIACVFSLDSEDLSVGKEVNVTIMTLGGSTGAAFKGHVVKISGTDVWIEDKSNHIGCIVAIE